MHHIRFVAFAALLFTAAPAQAEPHNMRFYSVLTESAQITVDDGAARTLDDNATLFYSLKPGRHRFVITTASGGKASLTANLADDKMATSRGRNWWCALAAHPPRKNRLVLLLDTPAECQAMLYVAPENDDPPDSGP
jgi:hypothetical protein